MHRAGFEILVHAQLGDGLMMAAGMDYTIEM